MQRARQWYKNWITALQIIVVSGMRITLTQKCCDKVAKCLILILLSLHLPPPDPFNPWIICSETQSSNVFN